MSESTTKAVRRMRASCDQCHRHKLKCTYEEGSIACARCLRKKIACVRSQSRPVGRRVAKKEQRRAAAAGPRLSNSIPGDSESMPSGTSDSSLSENTSPIYTSSLDEDAVAAADATHFFSLHRIPDPLGSPFHEVPLAVADQPTPVETPQLDSSCLPNAVIDFSALTADWCPQALPLITLTASDDMTTGAADTAWSSPPHHHDRSSTTTTTGRNAAAADQKAAATPCSCLEMLLFALRDHHAGTLARESVHQALCVNKDALAAVSRFLECSAHGDHHHHHQQQHATSFYIPIVVAYALLCNVAATFAHALRMPGDSTFVFGAYTVDGNDGHELRRRIVLIGVRRIKQFLGRLGCLAPASGEGQRRVSSAGGGAERGGWPPLSSAGHDGSGLLDAAAAASYRPVCTALYRSLRRDVDHLIYQIEGHL
ncbi:hypothetical protein B0J12DRAFT_697971 [Macrophomina phaseolina]|uniref:Zn(2)-C6 fungal-type domain-containing protein n=1 Tax=Macrophomina phaseolina TaxID=35725 RepID=A0ABQ8GFF5_9PEZI|nr:hypothetical protein B0J12DRAFT_697971 [Macrophomina phaseolina]